MKPIALALEALEDRSCPSTIYDHGGPVLAHPIVDNLYIAGAQNEDGLVRVIAGDYLRVLTADYGVGAGSVGGAAAAPNLGPFISDYAPPGQLSELQTLLLVEMLLGQLPLPSASDVYVVHLAPGEHVRGPQGQWDIGLFAGYHSTLYVAGRAIPYAVVLDQGDTAKNGEVFSHEIAEAATDPVVFPALYGLGTGYQSSWPGWEIGDIYAWEPWQALDGYTVQVLAGPDLQKIDHIG